MLVWFEGRNTAGKTGVIHAIPEKLNTRRVRTVALDKPAAGDIVLIDRTWYNRAAFEAVMGFAARHDDPFKRWKLSPIDLAARDHQADHTFARQTSKRCRGAEESARLD